MKPKILRTDTEVHSDNKLREIEAMGEVVTAENNDEATLERGVEDAELILVSCFTTISSSVMDRANKLRAILEFGVGVDNIDIEAATERGIMVIHCPEYEQGTVADHAFTLMLSLARKVAKIDRDMKDKGWMWPSAEYCGVDLPGKTLGIIGLGRIGTTMARRARGFDMKLIACDPYAGAEAFERLRIERGGIEELLGVSDFVSIHCVLTPETRGLLGERELRRMKPTAYLINVSRGAIVDEAALVRALREGWIAGAGLDVFAEEPLRPGHPMLSLDNVILTPHLAAYTKEAFERLEAEAYARAVEVLEGKTPKNIKNPEVLEKLR